MHRKTTQEFMKKLAGKYNISAATVQDIAQSPFRFLVEVVMKDVSPAKGNYPTFVVSGLGKFVITSGRKEMLIRKYVEKVWKREAGV